MSDDQRRSLTMLGHRIGVLGSFTLVHDGATVPLGVDSRRLIAYLAVHPRPQQRRGLAADLWPGLAGPASLRLLDDAVTGVDLPGLLSGDRNILGLANSVTTDLADAMALVRALPDHPGDEIVDTDLLRADILPGWTAAWIAVERERFRQLRLHAMEVRSSRLTAADRHDDAIAMAQDAVHTAPSRESARRTLIEAHLAQGNIAAAIAEHDSYQELLRSSVGGPVSGATVPGGLDRLLPPSPLMPMVRARGATMPRSAVVLPGLRAARNAGGRRLVAGGSVPGTAR